MVKSGADFVGFFWAFYHVLPGKKMGFCQKNIGVNHEQYEFCQQEKRRFEHWKVETSFRV
jgi:hypothetical protein